MNSFIEANEQVGIDLTSVVPKLRESAKAYTFFLYYVPSSNSPSSLQKMSFRLREEKGWRWDKLQQGRMVHLFFIDLRSEQQLDQSFFDIKTQSVQSLKTKLIVYGEEHHLLSIIEKAKLFGINLNHCPLALYTSTLHGDLSQHLGWKGEDWTEFASKSSVDFEQKVKQWIGSPAQKIDLWSCSLTVHPEEGLIYKLHSEDNAFLPISQRQFKQLFLSHLSVGRHAQLAASYNAKTRQRENSVMNRFKFGFQSLKQFCCVGKPSLEASTGIVEVLFEDEKGRKVEISKQLRGEEAKRGVLTLLFSNIDVFQGNKFKGGRINDGKLEVGVLESSDEWRLAGTSQGFITLRFRAEQIFMAMGGECYRLIRPYSMRIGLEGKVKVLINKQTLQC